MSRDKSFDSLKFLLICLVVFGHAIGGQTGYNHLKLTCFSFIYSFHIPLFIFISGFFSKNMTWVKFKKSFISLFPTYIVLQTLFSIVLIFFDNTEFTLKSYLLEPKSVLWYLLGLLFWRLLFCFIAKYKIPFLPVFLSSIIISLFLGFSKDVIPLIRIITFLPYFILGYYCTSGTYKKIRNLDKRVSIVLLVIIFILMFLYTNQIFSMTLFGETIFANYSSISVGLIYKFTSYILAIIMSLCIINLVTEKFYKLGTKTLDVYLIHPFLIYPVYALVTQFMNPTWLVVDIILSIGIIMFCLFISNFKIIQYIINPSMLFNKK